MPQTILKIIADIILYMPRKVYYHFLEFEELKKENKELGEAVLNQQRLLRRIYYTSDDYMKMNNSLSYSGFSKIKELASTKPFPNDNRKS